MIPTPKQEFQRDKDRLRTVEQMLESTQLQAALLAAFNNFCWNLPPSETRNTGGTPTASALAHGRSLRN